MCLGHYPVPPVLPRFASTISPPPPPHSPPPSPPPPTSPTRLPPPPFTPTPNGPSPHRPFQATSPLPIPVASLCLILQEVYGKLEEPDGLAGLLRLRQGPPRLQDQLLAAEKAGSWSEALALHEQVSRCCRKFLVVAHVDCCTQTCPSLHEVRL